MPRRASVTDAQAEKKGKWEARQKRTFTMWINNKLAERQEIKPITDLYKDLTNGMVLYNLLEELSHQSLRPLGKVNAKARMKIQKVANMNIVFKYLAQTVKTVGIGPQDIVDSENHDLVLGLIWSIIVFFATKDLAGTGGTGGKIKASSGAGGVSALKKKIKTWINLYLAAGRKLQGMPSDVSNLTQDFADGKAFCKMVDTAAEITDFTPSDTDARVNFRHAFTTAEERFGVPQLLDAVEQLRRRGVLESCAMSLNGNFAVGLSQASREHLHL